MRPSGSRLLLHICCAPDAAVGIEGYAGRGPTMGLFYNPNIDGPEEYHRRLAAMERLEAATGFPWLEEKPDFSAWEAAVKGLEKEPERTGRRCEVCIRMRLRRTAERASCDGFDLVGTVLTAGRKKDPALVNRLGAQEAARVGLRWVFADLKKDGGLVRGSVLCAMYGIWRQDSCGCRYSRRDPVDRANRQVSR
jgi:predicted adenine nucleotide alpha hydrolase (AANH) superfamily ATPase